jgi:hypothetical protein
MFASLPRAKRSELAIGVGTPRSRAIDGPELAATARV